MSNQPLRVGILAPPWLTVPPQAYGGTELVVDVLSSGLTAAGHDVTLFTVGDSTCPVRVRHLFDHADPDRMGSSLVELRHVAAAYDTFAHPASKVDVVHDHTLAGLFVSSLHPELPVVATNHGPFDDDLSDLYGRVADRIRVIAISHDQAGRAPRDLPIASVIHHGLDLTAYPYGRGSGGYALFLGRMAADKGVDVAIRVARRAGLRLIIAAKMLESSERRFFHEHVEPELDDDVRYVGEADFERKIELLMGACALINPIRWPEPFGLVMAESLACGTPVFGFPYGAAPEIIDHGITGYLARDEHDLLQAVRTWASYDRVDCRRSAMNRFAVDRMVREHVDVYRSAIARRRTGRPFLMQSA